MNASAHAISEYTRLSVLSASNAKLIIMLYDGAIKFLEQARLHLSRKNTAAVGQSISRAYNIVSELKISLDPEAGGEHGRKLAIELDRLYSFVMEHLVKANVNRTERELVDALEILRTLKQGWDGAIQQTH